MAADTRAEDLTPTGDPPDHGTVGGGPSSPGPPEGTTSPRRNALRIGGILLVVALAVTCGWLAFLVWSDHREDELRRTAAEEATRLVVQLASYDHADVDANIEAVVAEATPEFADRYREVSEGLRELLTSGQGTSTGTVTHAGVQSVDTERAVVLVFLDQEVTNVTVPDGRVDASRMVVTLVRGDDTWLLDAAELA